MADEKDIALITSYLENELDEQSKSEFESRLTSDEEFRELFDDLKVLATGLGKLRHKDLLHRMDNLEEGLSNPLKEKVKIRTLRWNVQSMAAVFAGLAIVAFASWYVLGGDTALNSATLYEQYYQAYENTMVPTTRGEEAKTLIEKAFQAYDQGDYAIAKKLFEELAAVDDREFIRLHMAVVYMETGEADKATRLLTNIIEEGGDFVNQGRWYLALNYLKIEDYNKSIQMLESLEASETSYSNRAIELLKEIK